MTENLELVCKLCVLDRHSAKLPAKIDEQPRYPTPDALREHLNTAHKHYPGLEWKGTEGCWPMVVREAHAISLGVMAACGDLECTHHVLWCLHCDYETSDPLMVEFMRCPKCGRDYSSAYGKKAQ